ncbi:MAG: hypothetical protein LVS60_03475 [Nodosilinea sp. LVE1205-7]
MILPSLLGVALLSTCVAFFWLAIPVFIIQICIDKVIVQQEAGSVIALSIFAIVIFLFASGLEIVLGILTARVSHHPMPESFLKLAIELPKILLSLALIFFYNKNFAALTCLIVMLGSVIFCFIQYIRETYQSRVEKRVQSFIQGTVATSSRILIGFTALLTFLSGIALIVRSEITLGQLAVFICISVQLTISISNTMRSIIQLRPV